MTVSKTGEVHHGLSSNIDYTFPENLTTADQKAVVLIFQNAAKSLRQLHVELCFDRLLHIIVSRDVWQTVTKLESMVGHVLPAGRNGAQNGLAFSIDLGDFDVLIYRSELLMGSESGHQKFADSLWHYISNLCSIDYYTKVKAKFTKDPWRATANRADLALFGIASQLLECYWTGYFGCHPQSFPDVLFQDLAATVTLESAQIECAFAANAKFADDSKLFKELHTSAMNLCGAMANVMGYCDAGKFSLATISPELWTLITKWNLEDVWQMMQPIASAVFSRRHQWANSTDLLPLYAVPNYLVEKCGVGFTSDGGTSAFRSVPSKNKSVH